ncbi:thioredoxin-like [Brachionichthys hirsutus]|uniref:thioredoxin-like n=1 Tax=Brachionichthys hirsutus TaxID=412623 RepID=UPI00360518F3
MGIIKVGNMEDFDAEMGKAGGKLVVVDFTAAWCGPCKMIAPIFEAQSKLPENANVIFLKVDVDEATDVSSHCDVSSMPTFQFYKNGHKIEEFSGANKEKLLDFIKQLK